MSVLNVNTINERTSASGVTIDGVLIKDNKLASGTGNVLQVVSGTDASAVNITSTSMTDTGLSASITPSATSSKILVLINHNAFVWGPGAVPFAYFQVLRDSTNISGGGDGIAFGMKAYLHGDGNNYKGEPLVFNHLDSPSTTSSVTYKTQARYAGSGSGYIRTAYNDQVDSLILLEIGG
jgi:hypothetical protein